jgi:predicted nucleic-acid-binding protein
MAAVDTNVVVRYLVADDPDQFRRARQWMESGDVWISVTVLLETGWVLGSVYGLPPSRVAVALRRLAGLPGVALENPPTVAQALTWFEDGVDFADALHLAAASGQDAFLTFDRRLAKTAKMLGSIPVRSP